MRIIHLIGAIVAVGLASASAQAGRVIQFDINSLTASVGGPGFGTSFTGTVTLTDDADSSLAAILIDGAFQGIAAGQLGSFAGTITLLNGFVTGGSFSVTDTSSNMYSATILNDGLGRVHTAVNPGGIGPGPFTIDGTTFMGAFNSTTFAGVDVTPWQTQQPLFGSLLQIKLGPDAQGFDPNTDIEIFAVVPLPLPAGLGGLGLLSIGFIRRRR